MAEGVAAKPRARGSKRAPGRAMISSERIAKRVGRLGHEISEVYAGSDTPLVLVAILKGATVFAADLLRSLSIPAELEFVRAASYGAGTKTSGRVKIDFTGFVIPDRFVIGYGLDYAGLYRELPGIYALS